MTNRISEIVVKAGARRSEVVCFEHRRGDHREQRLRIVLEPGSELELQELHYGRSAGELALQIDVELAQGARMRHAAVLDDPGGGRFTTERTIRLAGQAELEYTRLSCGAASDREILHANMEGRDSRFRHGALLLVEPGRHAGLELEIAHGGRRAASESLCRCIVSANGSGRFAGRIRIDPQGQGADARLRNDNLLLHETARMETRPELEVYADEVQCAHGAATGALDEAALFYLRTRGLTAPQARAMLVRAFASRISDAINLADAQTMAGTILNRALRDDGPGRLAA